MAVWPFTAVRQVPVRKNGQRLAGNMVALPPFIVPLLEAGLLLEAGKFSYAAYRGPPNHIESSDHSRTRKAV